MSSHTQHQADSQNTSDLDRQRQLAGIDNANNTGAYILPLPGDDPKYWDHLPGRGVHAESTYPVQGKMGAGDRVVGECPYD